MRKIKVLTVLAALISLQAPAIAQTDTDTAPASAPVPAPLLLLLSALGVIGYASGRSVISANRRD
jgi:hypothetical protein